MKIINWKGIPDVPGKGGLSVKKLIEYPDAAVVMINIPKGDELKPHVTPVDVLFYVVEGSGELQIDDEIQEIHQDDLIFSPKGIKHGLRNSKSDRFRFLVIKTPNPATIKK